MFIQATKLHFTSVCWTVKGQSHIQKWQLSRTLTALNCITYQVVYSYVRRFFQKPRSRFFILLDHATNIHLICFFFLISDSVLQRNVSTDGFEIKVYVVINMNISGNHEPGGGVSEKNFFTFRQCVWCSPCQIFPHLFPLNQHFMLNICRTNKRPSKTTRIWYRKPKKCYMF